MIRSFIRNLFGLVRALYWRYLFAGPSRSEAKCYDCDCFLLPGEGAVISSRLFCSVCSDAILGDPSAEDEAQFDREYDEYRNSEHDDPHFTAYTGVAMRLKPGHADDHAYENQYWENGRLDQY